MDLKPVIIAAAAALSIAFSSQAQNSLTIARDSLTLDDCLTIAMTNSPTVKVADMEI